MNRNAQGRTYQHGKSATHGSQPLLDVSATQTARSKQVETSGQPVLDSGDLLLRYQARKSRTALTENYTVGSNPEVLEKLISELNQRLILPFDIDVSFEDCEQLDAYYDPEKHQITLCHQLIDDYYYLFTKKFRDKTKLHDAVKSATAATFFHELGHSLVDAWKIPITGRGEDAVDQLSTLVLIEGTEDGEQMALDGALIFKLYADLTKGEKKIYWDEHSLDEQRFFDTICLVYRHDDEQRFFNTVCLVYGHRPQQYEYLNITCGKRL